MIRFFAILFVIIISAGNVIAQQKRHASQVQMELLGPGSLFSFNFDSRFSKKENGIGYRIGIGGAPLALYDCNSGVILTFPAGFNYLVGRSAHYLELGVGGALIFIGGTKVYCPDEENIFFIEASSAYGYLMTGYRYQHPQKKLTYRLFLSPLFGDNIKLWGGIGIGYKW